MWSVGECLAHLNITNQRYADSLAHAVEKGRAERVNGKPPFRYGLLERVFLGVIGPPVRFRFKAPPAFAPPSEVDKAMTLAAWRETHLYLLALADASLGLDLSKVKVESPINARLKFGIGATFAIIEAHDRRHLGQAERVKGQLSALPQ